MVEDKFAPTHPGEILLEEFFIFFRWVLKVVMMKLPMGYVSLLRIIEPTIRA